MRSDGISKRRGLRTKFWDTSALRSQRNYQKLGKEYEGVGHGGKWKTRVVVTCKPSEEISRREGGRSAVSNKRSGKIRTDT